MSNARDKANIPSLNFSSTGIDDNATSTAITIDSSENIGIGTASPQNTLHVIKNALSGASYRTNAPLILENSSNNELQILSGNSSDGQIRFGDGDANFRGAMTYVHSDDSMRFVTNSSEAMRITSGGYVGIGTSSPSSALDIIGGLTVDGNSNIIEHNITRQTGTTNTSRPVIKLTVKNTASDVTDNFGSAIQFRMKDNTADTELGAIGFLRDGADGSGKFVVGQDSQLLSSSPQFIVKSSGNVGIGTSSPAHNLEIVAAVSGSINDTLQIRNNSGNTGSGSRIRFITSNDSNSDTNGASLGTVRNGNDNAMFFETENTERMRIDSSGNVGIGETSIDALLVIKGNSNSSTTPSIRLKDGTDAREAFVTNQSGDLIMATTNSSDDAIDSAIKIYTSQMIFSVDNNTERMRINSSGNLLIGTTSAQRNDREAVEVKNTTGEAFFASTNGLSNAGYIYKSLQSAGGTHYIAWFENSSGTNVGKITHNNSSTSFTTTSDHRLKENVSYDFDATTRLKQLRPARFNFIADADTTVDGFLAHEVQSVVPEAITGTHNEVEVWKEGEELPEGVSVGDNKLDGEGNTIPVYQGIDQAKLVPLLVKTIQELEARITALETNQP